MNGVPPERLCHWNMFLFLALAFTLRLWQSSAHDSVSGINPFSPHFISWDYQSLPCVIAAYVHTYRSQRWWSRWCWRWWWHKWNIRIFVYWDINSEEKLCNAITFSRLSLCTILRDRFHYYRGLIQSQLSIIGPACIEKAAPQLFASTESVAVFPFPVLNF